MTAFIASANEPIPSLVENALHAGADLLIAAGGDGTLHAVMNALLRLPFEKQPPIAILPLGTGNDFAKMMGITPALLKKQTPNFQLNAVDAVCCGGHYYINDFGTGLFSQATFRYHHLSPRIPGQARYIAAALGAIAQAKDQIVRIEADGALLFEGPMTFAAVCNGRWTGGRFLMNPNGSVIDGILDVYVCHGMQRLELLRHFPKLLKGHHIKLQGIKHWAAQTIKISSADLRHYQTDGEIFPFPGQLQIEVRPSALQILGLNI